MSTLKVLIVEIELVRPHPDPETTALDLIPIGGWPVLSKKGTFKSGDLAVYFPIDSILPLELSEAIGCTKYLSNEGRIKAAKLRGVPSYGLLWPAVDLLIYASKVCNGVAPVYPKIDIDTDLTEYLGVTKWEPPVKLGDGDAERPHTLFDKYTDIENYRNYNKVIKPGEEVIVTEKIHGTNSRFGLIDENENEVYMAGSHNVRKREISNCKYWSVFSQSLKDMLKHIKQKYSAHAVIAYGEIYGNGIQDLTYDRKDIALRLFDIKVDDKYLDYDEFETLTNSYNLEVAPVLYRGPFSLEKILSFEGKSSIGSCIIEGVVFKPVHERVEHMGRVVLKYVYDTYYNRKGNTTEFH
jgi:RNA ligase (TIGR02306 family)